MSYGHWDSSLRIYNQDDGRELHRFQLHDQEVTSLNTSEDGKFIACGYANGIVDIWDVEIAVYTR